MPNGGSYRGKVFTGPANGALKKPSPTNVSSWFRVRPVAA